MDPEARVIMVVFDFVVTVEVAAIVVILPAVDIRCFFLAAIIEVSIEEGIRQLLKLKHDKTRRTRDVIVAKMGG